MEDKAAGLLSIEALEWLKEQGYAKADHERRLELIHEAREMFGC